MAPSKPCSAPAWVDLYWIPLGAGDRTHLVRPSGRAYERVQAWRNGRAPQPLFHSALMVHADGATYAIEMAPAWGAPTQDRGVTGTGAVGAAWLGRSPLFRYEVRRWRDGRIPDLDSAVGPPRRMSADPDKARALLDAVPAFPDLVWGQDQLHAGDMWNSNSLIAWLLARSNHDLMGVLPPARGRAPGWEAGLRAARLDSAGVIGRPERVDGTEVLRTIAALPSFLTSPALRSWHLRWGATEEEVHGTLPGDDLVPRPHFTATRAISIDTPPDDVWPWLLQVGYGRAGFYSYDLLDSLGRPSANRILPQWQHLGPGELIAPMTSHPTPQTSFRIVQLERPSTLVWSKPDSSWAWGLTALPGGRTRLVTRLRQRYSPGPESLVTIPLLELGDFTMMRRMLTGLKQRAEAQWAPALCTPTGAHAGRGWRRRRGTPLSEESVGRRVEDR